MPRLVEVRLHKQNVIFPSVLLKFCFYAGKEGTSRDECFYTEFKGNVPFFEKELLMTIKIRTKPSSAAREYLATFDKLVFSL